MRLSRYRIIVVIAILLVNKVEESSATEPIISYLECKGLTSHYRNGVFSEFYSGVQVYYRIKLRTSDAVVEFRTNNSMYNPATRYDMKIFASSYELSAPWNISNMNENIKIDRLNGNFIATTIEEDIRNQTFGTCYKIDETPKF
jgi:hypothetical protein